MFLGEPGGHRLFFSGAANEVYVQIVSFADLSSERESWKDGELRWHGRIPTEVFIEAVELMGAEVPEQYGEEGYIKRWGLPFPADELAALRAAGGGKPACALSTPHNH